MDLDSLANGSVLADLLNSGDVLQACAFVRDFVRSASLESFNELNQTLAFRVSGKAAEVVVEHINGKAFWLVEMVNPQTSSDERGYRTLAFMDVVARRVGSGPIQAATSENYRIADDVEELPALLRKVRNHDETVANELSIFHLRNLAAEAVSARNIPWAAYLEREVAFLELTVFVDTSDEDLPKASKRLKDAKIALAEANRLQAVNLGLHGDLSFHPETVALEQQIKSMGSAIRV